MNVDPESRAVTLLYVGSRTDRARDLEEELGTLGIDCAVVTAETVDGVAAEAEKRRPAAVVAESGLADVDGLAALEACRERRPDVVTVLLGAADADLIDRACDAGVDEFVQDSGEAALRLLGRRLERRLDVGGDRGGDAGGGDPPPAGPAGDDSDAGSPGVDRSGAGDLATGKPSTDDPPTDNPTTDDPASAEHATGDPATDEFVADRHAETIAAAMSDAIVSIDASSTIRYANPAVEELFGYGPAEIVGEPLALLMSDDLAERHREALGRYLATGERRIDWDDVELTGRRRDGGDLPISVSFSEFTDDGTRYFTGVIRDVSERRRLESERELYHDTTQRILRADSFVEGLRTAVAAIGSAMDWRYGEAWTRDDDGRLVRVSEPYTASEAAETFAEATASTTFEPGEGLIGRVWASGEHEWTVDVTDGDAGFERVAPAAAAGLRAALAVPIVSDGTVVAVMGFFLPGAGRPDERTVEATRTIAADLGHLMKRLRAESAARRERALTERVLETSPVGICIVESDGTFRYINDRAADLLGLGTFDGPVTVDDLEVEAVSLDGEPLPPGRPIYRRVIDAGEAVSGEVGVVVSGEQRWLSVNGAPLAAEDGGDPAAVFSLEDVTERRERERRLREYEAVMQTVSDGVYALDDEGRFVVVNDAYCELVGRDRSELIGRRAGEIVDPQLTDEARGIQDRIEEGATDAATLEGTLTTDDGERVPIEARIALFELGGGRYGRAGVVRDITERKRREERLARLNEIGRALALAGTDEEVADVVVDGARGTLDLPLATLELYDEEAGRLRPGRRTAELAALVGDERLFAPERDLAWQAFADQEERVVTDMAAEEDADAGGTELASAIVVPVGTHGVLVAGSTEPDAFTEADVTAARMLVANARAALDRVDRERELREKTAQAERHAESLERLERLNRVVRGLTRKLTGADTREEIERAVCAELAGADPYVFAWIGEQRGVDDRLHPRASAGREDGYLEAVAAGADDGTGRPAAETAATREPAVRNTLGTDPPFEPWRREALRRGYRASVAVPLSFRDTLYGVLELYADEPGVVDETEAAVLGELGEMIGYAINALERKRALVSDAVVELVFGLTDGSVPAVAFARETGATFEFDTVVEQGDGSFRVFFSVDGADPKTVFDYAARTPVIERVSLLADLGEGEHRYEAVVAEGFLATLVSYGATPTGMTATPEGARVTVELPRDGDVRAFVRTFRRTYEGAELISRETHDRPARTREEFGAAYRERLTERQLEVIRTAYFSGFFESPRATTGTELAELLGVSQPTVSRHIRTGERKLLDLVFGDDW